LTPTATLGDKWKPLQLKGGPRLETTLGGPETATDQRASGASLTSGASPPPPDAFQASNASSSPVPDALLAPGASSSPTASPPPDASPAPSTSLSPNASPSPSASPAPSTLPPSNATYALFVLFAINTLNFFDRQLPGALGEPIRKDFHLSDTGLGLLGTVFTLIYAAVGLPIGRLTDRWVRTRLVAIGTAFWSLLTAASGIAQNYTQLFISRLGVGVGEAVCAPAGQSLIGDLFPPQKRARAMGVFMLGLPAGVFMAYSCAGLIGAAWGWRSAFLIACLPGLLFALLALRIREPVRGALDAVIPVSHTATPYLAVLKIPTMWWIILSGIFHNFNMYAINAFQTPFLQRFHEMSLKDASKVSAISVGAVGAIGLLAGGWLSDKIAVRWHYGRLLLSACCMALAAPAIFLALYQPKGAVGSFMALMMIGTITLYVYYASVYAAIQDVIAPQLRGTAVAIYFCGMYIFGASFGPVATGMLSDHFARQAMTAAGATTLTEAFKATGLHDAMFVIPILAGLASLVLFAAARSAALIQPSPPPSPAQSASPG
jgi:predicted MFS family arabinose efflux permease